MEHVKAMGIKLVVHLLWAWILFSLIFDFTVTNALVTAVIVAVLIYVVGDLVVLRKWGNVPATLLDAGSAFLVAWMYLATTSDEETLVPSLLFALGVAVFEWFFHEWLLKSNVIPDERSTR